MTALGDAAVARLREAVKEPDLTGTRYRLEGVAGRGGMGTVYVALDEALGRRVALKVLDLEDRETEARLRREAHVLARLEHPGIVPVHEVGLLADGRAFYTMKLVQGERLDRFAERALSLAERLRAFLRIADAVAFAHSRGVLHRDLKPQNVMVGPFGEVLVLDWGLAKVLTHWHEQPPLEGKTEDGAILGTPGFMSPEQREGNGGHVDQRTDVYSLGAILLWLIPASAPAPLRAIAEKAAAERPEDRYPDVPSLVEDVTRFLDAQPVSAFREGIARKALRLLQRHRVAVGILAAYLAGRGLMLIFLHR